MRPIADCQAWFLVERSRGPAHRPGYGRWVFRAGLLPFGPDGLINPFDLRDAGEHALQLLGVGDHDFEGVERLLIREGAHLRAGDVDVRAGDRRADRRQQAGAVDAADVDFDRPGPLAAVLPGDLDFS